MKSTKKMFMMAAAISLGLVIYSCESGDNEKPVISNFEPLEGDTLIIGKNVHLECTLTDNEKLASYKIDIHNNFDNHEHKSANTKSDEHSIAFSFSKEWTDIAGQKEANVHHDEISIPMVDDKGRTISGGKYHFVIYCLDAAGNQAVASRNVIIAEIK
ncbi:hypothetical protein AwDysgo_21840 [Bacteroidales bacterium]|nr:hypothetical protein AwDysgo_21840 [Bacteroidales bacterium]